MKDDKWIKEGNTIGKPYDPYIAKKGYIIPKKYKYIFEKKSWERHWHPPEIIEILEYIDILDPKDINIMDKLDDKFPWKGYLKDPLCPHSPNHKIRLFNELLATYYK